MKKIFFNSSLPRAGSTLLQNLIAQNPDFYVTPTSGVLELIYGARINYSDNPEFKAQSKDIVEPAFIAFCNEGMKGYFNMITDKPYVVDKSRGWGAHFGMLEAIMGEQPKIVCMVRDLRQIVSSMEKKYRENPLEHPNPPIDHNELINTTTEKRMIHWLSKPPIGLAMERLRQMVTEKTDQHILFIRFEDLTKNPQRELNRVYKYFGLKSFKHDPSDVPQVTKEDDSVYGIFGDHIIRKKVEVLDKDYLDILGRDLSDWLGERYKWYFKKFGYV